MASAMIERAELPVQRNSTLSGSVMRDAPFAARDLRAIAHVLPARMLP